MMNSSIRLALLLVVATCYQLAAQPPFFNQLGAPSTTTNTSLATTQAVTGSLNFVLFGDGTFGSNIVGGTMAPPVATSIIVPHQYPTMPAPATSSTFISKAFIIPPYTIDPPTERQVTVTVGNVATSPVPASFVMSGSAPIQIGTSWFPNPITWNFTIISFTNACSPTKIKGDITYYFNVNQQSISMAPSDSPIYNNWISINGPGTGIFPTTVPGYTHKLVVKYEGLKNNEIRHIYIKSTVLPSIEANTNLSSKVVMTTDCSNNSQFETLGTLQVKGHPHDPNSKRVDKKSVCYNNQNPHSLTYTITFQNDGTAEAEDIIVWDNLPPELDATSVQLTSFSGPNCSLTVHPPSLLEFKFYGIKLAGTGQINPFYTYDETVGSVSFRVNTIECLPVGIPIRNQAEVDFLFGQPLVQTTVAKTEVNETICEEACGEYPDSPQPVPLPGDRSLETALFDIMPNPVSNVLLLQFRPNDDWQVQIYDTKGQMVFSASGDKPSEEAQNISLNTAIWPSGVYFLRWKDADQHPARRIIKI